MLPVAIVLAATGVAAADRTTTEAGVVERDGEPRFVVGFYRATFSGAEKLACTERLDRSSFGTMPLDRGDSVRLDRCAKAPPPNPRATPREERER